MEREGEATVARQRYDSVRRSDIAQVDRTTATISVTNTTCNNYPTEIQKSQGFHEQPVSAACSQKTHPGVLRYRTIH